MIQAITADGLNDAENEIQSAGDDSLVERVVQTLVEARLNAHFFTGMCARNYTNVCPSGWTESEPGIACVPSLADPSVPSDCGTFKLAEYPSAGLKAEFALKCKAQWPCAACTRNFNDCPEKFAQSTEGVKGLCTPIVGYVGPCNDEVDFRKVTVSLEKARWAARCFTSWPCSPE